MKTTDWKTIVEFVGISAIIASLVFVGYQLRQEHSIAKSAVWSERNLIRAELASLVSDHNEIWVKGLNGDQLTDAEYAQFSSIANLLIYKQSVHYQQRNIGISPGAPEVLALHLIDMLETYPGLKSYWTKLIGYHRTRESLSPFNREVERLSGLVETGDIESVPIRIFFPPL